MPKRINASDIQPDDEWMQEDEWDEIYEQENYESIVIDGKYPKDCLHCAYRRVVNTTQVCALCTDFCKFAKMSLKADDLIPGYKSEECPIQGKYNDIFNHDISVMDPDYLLQLKDNADEQEVKE